MEKKILIKHWLLIKYRASVSSKKSLIIRLIGVAYFFILYCYLARKVIFILDGLFGIGSAPIIFILLHTFTSALIFILSLMPIISMLYYSDITSYFSLPIRKRDLVVTKMIIVLLSHYVLILFIYVPVIWYLSVIYNFPVLFYLAAIITILIIPFIPASLSLILVLVGVKLFKISEKKFEFIKKVAPLLIVLLAGSLYIFIKYNSLNEMSLQEFLCNNYLGSHLNILIEYMYQNLDTYKIVLSLIITGIISYLFFELSIFIGVKIYEVGSHQRVSVGKRSKVNTFSLQGRSKIFSLLIQEFTLLKRKPILLTKSLAGIIYLPILSVALFIFNRQLDGIALFAKQNETTAFILLVCFGVLQFGWNPLAISSFSRGKNELFFIKALPIQENNLLFIKIFTSCLIFLPIIIYYSLLLYIFIGVSLPSLLLWSILAIFISINGAILCTIFDILFPLLRWTDEQDLFRSRTAITSFHVTNSIFVACIGLFGIFINRHLENNLYAIFSIYLLIFLVILVLAIIFFRRNSDFVFKKLINN